MGGEHLLKRYLHKDYPTAVMASATRKTRNQGIQVGAYVIAWIDSNEPPIIETYAGYARNIRYCELLGIRAILKALPPGQSVSIIGSSSRVLRLFSDTLSTKKCDRGVTIMRDRVKAMIDERKGSVHIYSKGGDVLDKADLRRLCQVADAICAVQVTKDHTRLGKDPHIPEPVPYWSSELEMPGPIRGRPKKNQKPAKGKVIHASEDSTEDPTTSRKIYNLRSSTVNQREVAKVKETKPTRAQKKLIKRQKKKSKLADKRDQHVPNPLSTDQQQNEHGADFVSLISDEEYHHEAKSSLSKRQHGEFGDDFVSLISDDEYSHMEHNEVNDAGPSKTKRKKATACERSAENILGVRDQGRSPVAPVEIINEANPFLRNYHLVKNGIAPALLHEDRKRKTKTKQEASKPKKKRKTAAGGSSTEKEEHVADPVVQDPPKPKGWFSSLISKFM